MSNWNSNNYYSNREQLQPNEYYSNNYDANDYVNFSGTTFYNSSFNDNRENFYGYNSNESASNTANQPGPSIKDDLRHIDISRSNLTPTAAEFKPRNISVPLENNVSNGTVRRVQINQYRTKKSSSINSSHENTSSANTKQIKYHEPINTDKIEQKSSRESKGNNFKSKPSSANTEDLRNEESGKYQADRDLSENYRDFRESGSGKNYHRFSRNNDFYYNGHFNNDSKRRWNKNSHHKYNRNYEDQRSKSSSSHKENWRQPSNDCNDADKERQAKKQDHQNLNQSEFKYAASQRERLQEMLQRLQLECMVCCEKLRHTDHVWSCKQCYNILHLSCVKKWANTSKMETGWRCPACQNNYPSVPKEYYCYCDKMISPRYEPGTLPHSCGELCGRRGKACDHTCVLLCHPGPCPDCTVPTMRACGCGLTKATVTCCADVPVTCQNVCGKILNCGVHTCISTCHPGECRKCGEFVIQECYCGKLGRKVPCTAEVQAVESFACENECGKVLDCGNHTCQLICHSGSCAPCPISPQAVTTCPCGQTKLTVERKSCFDPVPCCDKICNKTLPCGQPSDPHRCENNCHEGPCSPCPLTTTVKCRCGYMDKEIPCKDLTTKADDARCQKKCTKMRLCCKHKCNQMCCIEIEHKCPLPCNRPLFCGLHRCEEDCHRGRCGTCWRSSFQELYCECGASVIYPPVPCGMKPPNCTNPCSRPRSCGHNAFHNCHTGLCPPCTVLCKRWCHGKHEQRTTILCHQDDFSCGLPCGKEMPCGQHKCIQTCHSGACQIPCTQPCPKVRQNCEHSCNQPCHEGDCPDVACRQNVRVTCQCGLRSSMRVCMDLTGEYQSITMSQLASKIADIQKGQAIDITDIVSNQKKCGAPKTLECTEECRVAERNRRLAIGLQIRNPDLSAKLTPRYSDFMRAWAKKDPRFCQHVHDRLTELVHKAKQSKQKSRSHSFETMNRDKRQFVHEYCQMFGCDSEAYDAEPNRNVVATAYRDKSWLPSISLLELIQRESGQRKVPGPVLENNKNSANVTRRDLVPLKHMSLRSIRPPTPPGECVDYFDDPPL